MRAVLIWSVVAAALVVPVLAAAFSPLLAWRQPIYIGAGFAGIIGLCLMLLQPLLIGGHLPGLAGVASRLWHRWIGAALVGCVLLHVAGLWITSPPDVIDALTFTSPTLFTPFGVVAMWAVFGAAALAVWRRSVPLRLWRRAHGMLVCVATVATVVHTLLIDGTMESLSKWGLSLLVLAVVLRILILRKLLWWPARPG